MRVIAAFIFFFFNLPLFGQNSYFYTRLQAFSKKEGYHVLEAPSLITQDKSGLLWIGSDNGLIRFDGKHFKNFRHDPGDTVSAPSNHPMYCYQDRKGRYWTWFPNHGLHLFDPAKNTFTKFRYKNEQQFNVHKLYSGLPLETSKGELWFPVPTYGIARWDDRTGNMIPYRFCKTEKECKSYLKISWPTRIKEDPADGTFWIVTNDGLAHFNPTDGTFIPYRDVKTKLGNIFTDLFIDTGRTFWLATWGSGIKKFDPVSKRFQTYKWENIDAGTRNIVTDVGVMDKENLWLNTLDSGLMLFHKPSASFVQVRSSQRKDQIKGVHFFQNKQGVVWAGGSRELYRVHPKENPFQYVSLKQYTNQIPGAQGVYSFLKKDSIIYAGVLYEGRLIRYDARTGKSKVYFNHDVLGIRKLMPAVDDKLWVSTATGLLLFDPTKEAFTKIPLAEFSASLITDFTTNEDGSLYIATWDGLFHYRPADNQLKKLIATNEQSRIEKIFKGSNNRLWLGTIKEGLSWYDLTTGAHTFLNNRHAEIPAGACFSIEQTADGRILFSIDGKGLAVLSNPFTQSEKVTFHHSSNGLPSDQVLQIFRDKSNRFWLFTTAGMCLLNTQNMTARVFTETDGMEENIIYSNPYEDDEGNLYLGYGYSFQYFNPDDILKTKKEEGHLFLSAITTNGTELKMGHDRSLTLPHDQTNLSFSFSYLSKTQLPDQLFQVKMEGLDDEWSAPSPQAVAQYNNLAPGTYTLRIRAVDENGAWQSKELQVPIEVNPPWYNTWWFWSLLGAGVLLIIFSFFRFRIKQIERENRLKTSYHKQVSEMEMRALRAQMNPHFIFNCLASINRYIVKSDHKTASNYLTKFAKLVRLILDNSAVENVTLDRELQTLQLYIEMEVLRFDHAFDYKIEIDPSISVETLLLPSMLLQPYIENAIWHGLLNKKDGKGKLWITIQEVAPLLLRVEIKDNGVGRLRAQELRSKEALHSKSYGMQLSQERLKLMRGVFNKEASVSVVDLMEKEHPSGTSVVIDIPIQYG